MPYHVTERLYVDKDDKVYTEDQLTERSEVRLLMSAGGELTDAEAERYGLTKGAADGDTQPDAAAEPQPEAEPDAKAKSSAPANKAVSGPAANKARS